MTGTRDGASLGTLVARSPIAAGGILDGDSTPQKTPRRGVSTKAGAPSANSYVCHHIDTRRQKPIINVTVRPETCSVTAAHSCPEPDKESAHACIPRPNAADRHVHQHDL